MKKILIGFGVAITLIAGCGGNSGLSVPTARVDNLQVSAKAANDSTAEAFLRAAMDAAYASKRDPASTAFRKAADASATGNMALKIANSALQMKYFDSDARYTLDKAFALKAPWSGFLDFAQNAAYASHRDLASNGFRRAADRCETAKDALRVAEVAQGLRYYDRDASYAMDKAGNLP